MESTRGDPRQEKGLFRLKTPNKPGLLLPRRRAEWTRETEGVEFEAKERRVFL